MLTAVLVTALGWASAPLPKAAGSMAGSWDVKWGDFDARLDLRPNGSARFKYTPGSGPWEGTWAYDPGARRLTLTLTLDGKPTPYDVALGRAKADGAEGRVRQGASFDQPLMMRRVKGPEVPGP